MWRNLNPIVLPALEKIEIYFFYTRRASYLSARVRALWKPFSSKRSLSLQRGLNLGEWAGVDAVGFFWIVTWSRLWHGGLTVWRGRLWIATWFPVVARCNFGCQVGWRCNTVAIMDHK